MEFKVQCIETQTGFHFFQKGEIYTATDYVPPKNGRTGMYKLKNHLYYMPERLFKRVKFNQLSETK